MLLWIALVGAGFVAGILFAAIPALYIIGIFHAEAVRIVDGHNGMMMFSSPTSARGLRLVSDNE